MNEDGGTFEFVVTGSFGPVLRSMLSDLDIDERHTETRLRLTNAAEEELFSLLAKVVSGGYEVERVLIDER